MKNWWKHESGSKKALVVGGGVLFISLDESAVEVFLEG